MIHSNYLFSLVLSGQKKKTTTNNQKQKPKKQPKKNTCLVEVPSWRNEVNFRKIGKVLNEHPSYLMCMVNQKEKEKIHGNQIFTLAKDENSLWKS